MALDNQYRVLTGGGLREAEKSMDQGSRMLTFNWRHPIHIADTGSKNVVDSSVERGVSPGRLLCGSSMDPFSSSSQPSPVAASSPAWTEPPQYIGRQVMLSFGGEGHGDIESFDPQIVATGGEQSTIRSCQISY